MSNECKHSFYVDTYGYRRCEKCSYTAEYLYEAQLASLQSKLALRKANMNAMEEEIRRLSSSVERRDEAIELLKSEFPHEVWCIAKSNHGYKCGCIRGDIFKQVEEMGL